MNQFFKLLGIIVFMILSVGLAQAQSITITSPNGSEVWQGCTVQTITWVDSGTSNFYSIDYSVDNGATWTSIATFYNTTQGQYTWTLPNIQSTQALIRVQDSNNTLISDVTNATFSMVAPLLLTSPNGGQQWPGGSNQTITWVATGTSNYYSLDYSIDGGNNWISINSYFYNTNGSYNWSVPNNPSVTALVRVSDYNAPCKTDKSNAVFEIPAATPTITVTSPNTGLTWYVGQNYNLTWTSQYVTSNQVQLDYSIDGGATWIIINSTTANDGAETWNVPATVSNQCLFRVTDLVNTSTFDVSNSLFTIAEPFINLTSPNGGEVYTQCESIPISWTRGGTSTTSRLYYSLDNGATWTTLVASVAGNGYTWQPVLISGQVKIKVADYSNALLYDESDANFTIVPNNDLIVTSANGGETLIVGTNHTITWVDNNVANCDIYYSIDNGSNWLAIDTYDPSDGSYNWSVPNTPSTQCLIRIRDVLDSYCRQDVSNAVFTISQPAPVVTNPDGGEVLYGGLSTTITWTNQYISTPFVQISVSYDGGSSYTDIIAVTENDGSYSWSIPHTYSVNCLVRVKEVGGTSLEAISAAVFEVREPFINLTSPNGGEVYTQCESIPISWTRGGTSTTSRLYYSLDNGATWTTLVASVAGNGYTWQPVLISGQVKIKVADYSNASLFDESDASFTIVPNNDLIVTSANGGETLIVGTNHTITWVDNNVANCDIYYSIDNGSNWLAIDTYDPSDGSYNWSVPNTPSTQCLIRIRDVADSYCRQDVSNAVFTISQPAPVVTNPDGGEVLYGGLSTTITWTNQYISTPFVQISVSYDGGSSYTDIIAVTENDGSYSWSIPHTYSVNCLVRVKEVGGTSLEAISAAVFEVREPFINLTSPNGGEVYTQCESIPISWTRGGTSTTSRLYYSLDNGATWTTLVASVAGNGYTWQPVLISGQVKIKVADYSNVSLFDESDASFTIVPNNDLIVTSANGGETLIVGTNHTITWVDNNVANCDIYYSIDNGSNWLAIDTYDPSDGSYNWSVPNTPSTQCLIRIRDIADSYCRQDVSNAVFTISQPAPVVTNPDGGELYYGGQSTTITWTNQYMATAFVQISVSYDGGSTFTDIVAVTENDGSYSWSIPHTYSVNCLVRVKEVGGTSLEAISAAVFEVREPFINLTSPNGGEVYTQCESIPISWTRGGTSTTSRLYYSLDNGATWTTLVASVAGNGYTWQPVLISGQVKIKVADYSNALLYDESDANFTIVPNNDLIVTSANGGETLIVGTNHTITWVDNNVANCDIYYSIDNGSNWLAIDTYDPSDGSYNWSVPNTPSTQCLIRIRDVADSYCRQDVSNAVFTISQPAPVVTNPDGGEVLYGGLSTTITWTNQYISTPFVQISVSYDGGSSYTDIIAVTENDGSYSWSIPHTYSVNCLVRVKEVGGTSLEAISAAVFEVREPFINLTSPNGGEVYTQCESIPISWTRGGTSTTSRLYYSLDNGATWTTLVASVAGNGYTWQPVLISGQVKIKVADYSNALLYDESDANFTIVPNNDLIVTSANGGETLIVGTNHTITWVDNNVANCDIYYSIDNGSNWLAIDTYDPSDGSYNWSVPNTPSTQCLIRIRDVLDSYCRQDVSNAVFTISQPSPVVTNPDGGEIFYGAQSTNITWTNQYMGTAFVQISVSYNGGSTFTDIVAATENDGSYSWSIPFVNSENCLIRVKEVGGTAIEAISAEEFSIVEPTIEVISPNGDNGIQDWRVCTETTITWTSIGTSNYFKIWYSIDNGNTWISLNSNYYSPGINNTYNWVMPNIPTPAALVRVEDRYNATFQDISNNTFTIAPALTISVPNGGEVVGAGDVLPITWLNEGATNYYTIDYSSNGGSTWNSIVFNQLINGNTYNWTVPAGVGTNYLVRITDAIDGCKSDISNSSFEVASTVPGQISVLSPNGLEQWEGCTQRQITWDNINTSDYFDLDYSIDGGSTWLSIVSNYYSISGLYNWTLPNVSSNNVFVRVTDHNSQLYSDLNNVSFSLNGAIANAGADQEICLGESVFLQASGGVSYSWTPSSELDNATSSTPLATPTSTTEFTVSILDENGCGATDSVVITVSSNSCDITGCLDSQAYNYNPQATVDNGFCLYTEGGGGEGPCASDLNGDNVVNTADLIALLSTFGSICE